MRAAGANAHAKRKAPPARVHAWAIELPRPESSRRVDHAEDQENQERGDDPAVGREQIEEPRANRRRSRGRDAVAGAEWEQDRVFDERPHVPEREGKGESEADETGRHEEPTPSTPIGYRERDERQDEQRGLFRRERQPSQEPGASHFTPLREHGGREEQREHGDIDTTRCEEQGSRGEREQNLERSDSALGAGVHPEQARESHREGEDREPDASIHPGNMSRHRPRDAEHEHEGHVGEVHSRRERPV